MLTLRVGFCVSVGGASLPFRDGMVTDGGMDDKFAKVFADATNENGAWRKKIEKVIASRQAMLALLRTALTAEPRSTFTPKGTVRATMCRCNSTDAMSSSTIPRLR